MSDAVRTALEVFRNDYFSLFSDGTLGISDGVGYISSLTEEEIQQLYVALKQLYETSGKGGAMEKRFSATAVIGLYTGYLLSSFSEMHEAAEQLMGHPIFTHEFADRSLVNNMKKKLLSLFPEIIEAEELVAGCNERNYEEKALAITEHWPNGFILRRGGETRKEDPISSAERIFSECKTREKKQ
jgi:hypothetical protein